MQALDSEWSIALPPELHPFIQLVLGAPELQRRLASIFEADAFAAEAVSVAAENNIPLDLAALKTVMRPDPLGIGRYGPAPITCSKWPPSAWLPMRSVPTGGAPDFDWLWVGDRPLTRSFFEDEVRIAGSLPFNWIFRIRTTIDAVIAGVDKETTPPLAGLIYHMSRCGSTLLAQMFAALPKNAVSSEPEPLDAVTQWMRLARIDPATAVSAVRAIVAALGRDRGGGAMRHIIKLHPWQAHDLPLFRAAFPDVNWLYLYRDAFEVMVSTMIQPGLHTAPGLLPDEVVGVPFDSGLPREDFAASVLAGISGSVIAQWGLGGGLLLSYPDIIASAPRIIAAHFGISVCDQEAAVMYGAAKRDSKDSQREFSDDTTRKHSAVSPAIQSAVMRWLQPVEKQLNELVQATQ